MIDENFKCFTFIFIMNYLFENYIHTFKTSVLKIILF